MASKNVILQDIEGNQIAVATTAEQVQWDDTMNVKQKINNIAASGGVEDGAITTAKIASKAVTTTKIADEAVTAAKLASNAVVKSRIANLAVTTEKIDGGAVTLNKLALEVLKAFFYTGGDVISINGLVTAGYVTSASKQVSFFIPIEKPFLYDFNVNASFVGGGLILRQNGNYTHGSGTGTRAVPSSVTAAKTDGGIVVNCTMSDTTNATNNDAIAVNVTMTFTLSLS